MPRPPRGHLVRCPARRGGETDGRRRVELQRRGTSGLFQEQPPPPRPQERRAEEASEGGDEEPQNVRGGDGSSHGREIEGPEEQDEEKRGEPERDRDAKSPVRTGHVSMVAHGWSTFGTCGPSRCISIPSCSGTTRARITRRRRTGSRSSSRRCGRTGVASRRRPPPNAL